MLQHKSCPNCNGLVALGASFCSRCGYSFVLQAVPPPVPPPQTYMPMQSSPIGTQSATAAIMLSLFIPGGGAFYNHQLPKALMILFSPILLGIGGFLMLLLARETAGMTAIIAAGMWLFIPVVWIAQVVDSAVIAGRINRGEAVEPMQWF